MQPVAIFPRLRIVPLRDCVAHEGVVPRWVDAIATNILDAGAMKNPIIVSRLSHRSPRWIVIDGMHRFAALRKLEVRDILVFEIDYDAEEIELAGWDALLLRPINPHRFLTQRYGRDRRFAIEPVASLEMAQQFVSDRRAVIAVGDSRGRCYALVPPRRASVEQCVRISQHIDAAADEAQLRPLYVPDVLSLRDLEHTKAHGIILRPHFTKQEILQRTMAGKLFPRKSTRHLIPGRPLRLDVTVAWLRAPISLSAKNRVLQEHLRWCYESDRIRYYPEAVFVFAD